MVTVPRYDDSLGWVRVDGLVSGEIANLIANACENVIALLTDLRTGDKPHGRTRRLTALDERVPETAEVASALSPVVDQILPSGWTPTEIAFRCPSPNAGHQKLHADDVARVDPTEPSSGATAIVALVPFTVDSGATRVVPGSHRRIDLQRLSQTVDHLPEEEYLLGEPGTAFVFTRHLLHGGSINRSSRPRPALQISFAAGRRG